MERACNVDDLLWLILSLSLTRFITSMMYVDREISSLSHSQASSHTRFMKIDSRGNYCLRYCGKLNEVEKERERERRIKCKAKRSSIKRERKEKLFFRLFKCISICLLHLLCVYSHPFFLLLRISLCIHTHYIKETHARVQRDHCVRSHTAWLISNKCMLALMSHRGKINFIILFSYSFSLYFHLVCAHEEEERN